MLSQAIKNKLIKEIEYSTSLSGGPGGQNVNKVNTKVELRFHIENSVALNPEQKQILIEKLKNRINKNGYLALSSQKERTQLKNKETVTATFLKLLEKALKPIKKRIPTKPNKLSKLKRLEEKRIQSDKKERRKNVDI
ncbi:MAG: aminoacyl-tRNA hydrolase [Chlorobi bacterium]|nr:aminoacyl-tRNA hydrolase [Chlorobiota bacterium]